MSTTDETRVVFTEKDGELNVVAAGDPAFCDDAIANYEGAPERAFVRRVVSPKAVYAATEEII